jgi:hypothetical protein
MSQSTELLLKLPEMEITLTLSNGIIRRTLNLDEWTVHTFTGGKTILSFLETYEHMLTSAVGEFDLDYILMSVRANVKYYADWTEASMLSPSPMDETKLIISCFS